MAKEIDDFGAELVQVRSMAGPDHQSEMRSLERLYARTLHRLGELEATLTATQAECTRLLEENRKLRGGA